jgi:hypothetical protein
MTMSEAIKYTETFTSFWKAYPRKTGKFPAFKAWEKSGIDSDLILPKQIVQDVEKRTRYNFWPEDHTKIPHAATFINQRRWDDEWMEDLPKGSQQHGGRKKSNSGFGSENRMTEPENNGPDLNKWQKCLNRMFMTYVRASKGLEDIGSCVKIKNDVLKETVKAFEEDIENGVTDTGQAATEMVLLMLTRLDQHTGLSLRHKVMKEARKG